MDRELWTIVLDSVKRCAKRLPRPTRRPAYADWLIVAIYLWGVWHERPLCWGCDDRARIMAASFGPASSRASASSPAA